MHDLVGAAGAVDLLSSAAAADTSIFSVTKKGDPPAAGAGPVAPPAAGQTVSPGGRGVTYRGAPPPEAASISADPKTPGFAAPGVPFVPTPFHLLILHDAEISASTSGDAASLIGPMHCRRQQ